MRNILKVAAFGILLAAPSNVSAPYRVG